MTVRLKIILAFCLSIVILIIAGISSYRSTNNYKNASEWVSHTQQVISQIEDILLDVQGIETSQRGFVITGQEKYLVPYEKDLGSVETAYARLREMINDNPEQQALLDTIHKQILYKIDFSGNVIAIRKRSNFEAAQRIIATDRGQNIMENIRRLVDRFIGKEKELLSGRLVKVKHNFVQTVILIVSSIALAILIVLVTMYFFILDYNKRVKSEKKVLESESRLRKFMDSLPLGVFIVRQGRIPYYENKKFKDLFRRDLYPDTTSFPAFIAGTDTEYPQERLPVTRALHGEENIFIEDMEVQIGDRRIPMRINATPVTNLENEIDYAITVCEDISDVKETEKKLIEAKKLAEQSAMLKEAFLANMSHEIRTPMNAIIGFTDLLLKKQLQPEEKEYVQTIKNSGENLMRIINDILDVSKIDSGMMTFEEHPINLRELFNSIHTMLAEKAKSKKLGLTFETDANVPDTVLGDPTRLTQIIINLVGNAIKFTKEGAVSVYTKLLQEDKKNYRIEFSVKDTGIGIPEDKIQSIFERFRQAESHTTRNYGGTGLGLSIAKQLVELQGGRISISSTVNAGSEFTFTLTFKNACGANDTSRSKQTEINFSELGKLNVLIAEDNPVNIKFIMSLFSEYKIRTDVAENGKIAVEMLLDHTYDLVLMDMEMPEMNGYEATMVIRNELKNEIPIIAMTAHAMAGEKEKCLQLGMNDYISKPIRADLLFEKMLSLAAAALKAKDTNNSAKKIINLDFLVKSMRGNKAVIAETIDVFQIQLYDDLQGLREGVGNQDYREIKNFSHRMKSTVSLMGIVVMEAILEQIEALAISGTGFEKIKELHEALERHSVQALHEIQNEKLIYV